MKTEQKVFDKFWFQKHQRKLLWLANSILGKLIFRYRKMGHYLENSIVKITPNSVTELLGVDTNSDTIEVKEHFFVHNSYARKLYLYLLPVWWFMHIWDFFAVDYFQLAPSLNFGFSTLTANPQSGHAGGNVTVDGMTEGATADNMTWATARSQASGSGVYPDAGAISVMTIQAGTNNNTWLDINRSIYTFNTGSLTSSATITAAVLSIFGTTGGSNTLGANPNVDIYTASPANNNTLVVGDFSQYGTTSQTGSPIAFTSWSTSAYNDFTFNVLTNISKTGVSPFGAKNANYDNANSAPTWATANKYDDIQGFMADNGSNMPKLVVTYTLPTAAFFRAMIGVGI